MLDKRLLWTGVSVCVVAAVAIVAAALPQQIDLPVEPIAEHVSDLERPASAEEAAPDYEYVIREHEGRIAVFRWGEEEPDTIFDKYVKHLPEYDRLQMEEGIPVQSYAELVARIEDFIS